MITVAIIEANRMVRESTTTMLNELPDIAVVFASDCAAFDVLKDRAPRLVLLDVGLPDSECLRITRRLRVELDGCDVVVMDLPPEHDGIAQLVHAGVAGFILKDATCDEFVETMRAVAVGGSVLPSRMTGSLFFQLANERAAPRESGRTDTVHMTPREREVIALIAQGKSNKEIALQLTIGAHTVKTHVRNVMEKLALNTRLQIAAYAHEHSA